MHLYSVYVGDEPEDAEFVRDGFSFFALVLPAFWMLVNRMWLVLIGYLVAVGVLTLLLRAFGLAEPYANVLAFGVNLAVAFEAGTLRRWTFARRGMEEAAVVAAKSLEDAEWRYFSAPEATYAAMQTGRQSANPRDWPSFGLRSRGEGRRASGEPLGVFPDPSQRSPRGT